MSCPSSPCPPHAPTAGKLLEFMGASEAVPGEVGSGCADALPRGDSGLGMRFRIGGRGARVGVEADPARRSWPPLSWSRDPWCWGGCNRNWGCVGDSEVIASRAPLKVSNSACCASSEWI